MFSETTRQLIDGLSRQIETHLTMLRNEEHHPQHGPDQSDYRIKTLREQVSKLRQMRNDLEDMAATPLHGGF